MLVNRKCVFCLINDNIAVGRPLRSINMHPFMHVLNDSLWLSVTWPDYMSIAYTLRLLWRQSPAAGSGGTGCHGASIEVKLLMHVHAMCVAIL